MPLVSRVTAAIESRVQPLSGTLPRWGDIDALYLPIPIAHTNFDPKPKPNRQRELQDCGSPRQKS